jgi:hypothetical protein
VVTAIYFVFMFIMIVPVMVISYIPLSGLTLMSVHGLLSGTTNSIEMSVMVIIQFVFVNLMLVGLAAMVVPLIRMALGRRPRLPGWR